MPYRIWPFVFFACWILAWVVVWATPPNVPPVFRVLMTLLASATSAATEVSALGQLRYYGLTGLAGWGLGTGLGGIVVAALPVYLTSWRGLAIRDSIGGIWQLAILVPLGFLVFLPKGSTHSKDDDGIEFDLTSPSEESHTSLLQRPLTNKALITENIKQNVSYAQSLGRPYMLPLLTAMCVQALVLGIPRTLSASGFRDFQHYTMAYGMTLQCGSLMGRLSVLFVRMKRPRILQMPLYIVLGLMVLNACFLFTTVAPFVMVLLVGTLAGATYSNIFATVMDEVSDPENQEFSLGTVGAGETAGLLLGGLAGALMESNLCGLPNDGSRWCHLPRPR